VALAECAWSSVGFLPQAGAVETVRGRKHADAQGKSESGGVAGVLWTGGSWSG
jgi:hypothetical protein